MARREPLAIPDTPSIIVEVEIANCVCGQNSRQASIHAERHGPVVKHATSELAALGSFAAKTTTEIEKFVNGFKRLTTV